MAWVVISRSCWDCGGEIAARLLDHEPTKQEILETADSQYGCIRLGGMSCINTVVLELGVNDAPKTTEYGD